MDNKEILKTAMVVESMIMLENQLGMLLPRKELIRFVKKLAKQHKKQITTSEIGEILQNLLIGGIVFYPRKDFVERVLAYKELQVRWRKESKWKRAK